MAHKSFYLYLYILLENNICIKNLSVKKLLNTDF